jgi:soluble lytic murein transglycosylase-like protein
LHAGRGRFVYDKVMRALLAVCLALPLSGGEYAVLRNGFRMRVDRVERAGDRVRLHAASGVTELPAAEILEIEADDAPPDPPRPGAPLPVPAFPATPRQLVDEAAAHHGLPPELVHSVALAESAYRQTAVSPKGAIGIMQLMPGTARELKADPHDPKQNIMAGTQYLRELLLRYDGDVAKALAAYNAGPGAVDRYRGVPPYRETVHYVDKVLRRFLATKPAP